MKNKKIKFGISQGRLLSWLLLPVMLVFTFSNIEALARGDRLQRVDSRLQIHCQNPEPGTQNPLSSGIYTNPFQYSGYYLDAPSGLYYLNARYYSPELRRFISRDSYDLSNRYAYCDSNPVTGIDPNGHFVVSLTLALGVIIPVLIYNFALPELAPETDAVGLAAIAELGTETGTGLETGANIAEAGMTSFSDSVSGSEPELYGLHEMESSSMLETDDTASFNRGSVSYSPETPANYDLIPDEMQGDVSTAERISGGAQYYVDSDGGELPENGWHEQDIPDIRLASDTSGSESDYETNVGGQFTTEGFLNRLEKRTAHVVTSARSMTEYFTSDEGNCYDADSEDLEIAKSQKKKKNRSKSQYSSKTGRKFSIDFLNPYWV